MIFDSFNEAYVWLLKQVLEHGKSVAPRPESSLGGTTEILAADFGIPATMPLCTLAHRKMSYTFCMLEPIYLFTHQNETDIASALMAYAPNLKSLAYNPATSRFDGNYGDRINLVNPDPQAPAATAGTLRGTSSQLHRAFRVLQADPQSRRAVVTIHNPVFDIIDGDSRDIPCTLNLQFMIRGGKLNCFCTMRSNDLWYGTPHNVMMFTFLQRTLAGWLNVDPGMYFHRANSLHIYDQHKEKVQKVIDDPVLLENRSPAVTYPSFREPDMTEARMRDLMQWEKSLREKSKLPFQPKFWPLPGYETELLNELRGFWERKRAESKAN